MASQLVSHYLNNHNSLRNFNVYVPDQDQMESIEQSDAAQVLKFLEKQEASYSKLPMPNQTYCLVNERLPLS